MARKFIPFRDLELSPDGSNPAVGVTAADELFFNLDGRIFSTTDDAWRWKLRVHSSGSQHWQRYLVRSAGLTLRTENLDAGQLAGRVGAWLQRRADRREPSPSPIVY